MASTPRTAGPGGWTAYAILATLTAMNLLNYIDRFILAALLKPMGEELGLDDIQKGWLVTSFFISYTVFSPVVGALGDWLPRKYLLGLGVGIWSLATFGTGFVDSFGHALLARSILGIGEATYAILALTLISDLFPAGQRNRACTIFYMAIPIGAALGYSIGGAINASYGWRWAFYVVGLPGLFTALATLLLPEPQRGATEEVNEEQRRHHATVPLSWGLYAALLRNRSFVFDTLGMALMTFAMGGLQAWTPKLSRRSARDEVRFGELPAWDRGGPQRPDRHTDWRFIADLWRGRCRGAYFWVCGVSMLFSVPFVMIALLVTSPELIFAFILIGLNLALMNYGPSNTILVNVTKPRIRAAAIAVNLLGIHLLGDIPSPVIIGYISDVSGSLLLGLVITIPALALSGVFFCLGASHLEADQEAMLREMREGEKPASIFS